VKKILLKPGNEGRIAEALSQVNGRAVAHTITDFAPLSEITQAVERGLVRRGATKRSLRGAQLSFTPAGPGKAYAKRASTVISTTVTLELGPLHWGLIDIQRTQIWADSSATEIVALPDAAIEKIAYAALGDLHVLESNDQHPVRTIRPRALKLARLPCASAHERMALFSALAS